MTPVRPLARGLVCVLALAGGVGVSMASASEPTSSATAGGTVSLKSAYQLSALKTSSSAPDPGAAPIAAPSPSAGGSIVDSPLEAPKPAPVPVPVPPPVRVTVRTGESLYDIAARLRSPVRSIIDANSLTPPYQLAAGQVLTVPRPATYTVREGDTLYAVARRFMVDVHTLASVNDLTLQSRLRVGQPIVLPSDARDSGPVQVATAPSATPAPAPSPAPTPYTPTPRPTPPPMSPASRPALPTPTPMPTPRTPSVIAPADTMTPPTSVGDTSGGLCATAPAGVRGRRGAHTVADAYTAVERSVTAVQPEGTAAAHEPPPVAQTPFDTAAVTAGSGRFGWPAKGVIVSTFGPKPTLAQNDGIDIGAAYGTPVLATADGRVVFNGAVAGQGKTILMKHYDDSWASVYGQLSKSLVKNDERVVKGQVIACVGQGANINQPQLHFELRFRPTPTDKHRPVNPLLILPPDGDR